MMVHLLSYIHVEFESFDAHVSDADVVILVGDTELGGVVSRAIRGSNPVFQLAADSKFALGLNCPANHLNSPDSSNLL